MKLRPLCLLVPLLLLSIEGGVNAWRNAEIEPSKAPLFCWKGAELLTKAPPELEHAFRDYRPDRGAERKMMLPNGRRMTIFYFEWDQMNVSPVMLSGGHEAEVCGAAEGFKVIQTGGHRSHKFSNGETLTFDFTLLAEPNDMPVYIYKISWVQGYGTLEMKLNDRAGRIQRSFLRHRGASRVLEAGIFGAANEDEAWATFQHEVLEKLVWSAGE